MHEFIEAEQRLLALAATQMGLFRLDQAAACGVSRLMIATRLRAGRWERPYPKVIAVAGVGWYPARTYMAAAMAGGTGAMESHRAAAWLWALTAHPQTPEISIQRSRGVRSNTVRIHRPGDLPTSPEYRLGVPTTGVNRTLIDLGAVLKRAAVQRALDRAIGNKQTTPMRVLEELNVRTAKGRSGVGPMRHLLDEAGVTGSHPPSVLEAKTRRLLKAAGLRDPDCELVAGPNGEYRLDFPFPEAMLDIEVEGWLYHSSSDAVASDMTRRNSLTLEGYAFLHYSWKHITQMPNRVIYEVRTAYRARAALFA